MSPDCPDIQWKLNNKSDSLDGYFDYLARHQHPTSIPISALTILGFFHFNLLFQFFYTKSGDEKKESMFLPQCLFCSPL